MGLIDTVPSWHSSIKLQPVYETADVQAFWTFHAVYGEYQELRANRVDARIVNNNEKQVIALVMSCPWVSNRDKTSEKTIKYAPLRWELKQRYPGYDINHYNIILDVLGG